MDDSRSSLGSPVHSRAMAEVLRRLAAGVEPVLYGCGRVVSTIRGQDPSCARRFGLVRRLDDAARSLRRVFRQPLEQSGSERLYPAVDLDWVYHDEHWERVVRRWEHRDRVRNGQEVRVCDRPAVFPPGQVVCRQGSLLVNLPVATHERWVWLCTTSASSQWSDYRWTFRVRRVSPFRELQFGFRYRDFYDRYRFRHEDDALHFDIAHRGEIHNSIKAVPFVMQLDRDYNFAIEVKGYRFLLFVDGHLLLDEIDPLRLFPLGGVAVILWEDNCKTPIQAKFEAMEVVKL